MDLRDYLEAVIDAHTMEQVWQIHVEAMAEFGFDRLIYGFTRFRTANSFGAPEDLLILTNHDAAYTDRFIGENMYFHAPMVKWASENVGACSWGWINDASGGMTPSELKVVEFNRAQGVTAGYSVSFNNSSRRSKGAIALTGARGTSQAELDAMWARHGREIVLMNNVAHLKIIDLPFTHTKRSLTKRQRETLEWVGDGKTTQDIATIMGLTAATIEKHLRLAREALDVDTTAQAVLKASFQNQIFVIEG
ncbi:helix-turn-helix transcriptional regulator [Mangrovicoccus algicola]|uniref:LuxR family transcriptional regulator n=1 Tax=Mangrovicoccus algicola TaxID=2771008 RepID=A0A8J6YUB5_9RHOB|nr:LuxR family transcriptional regulator [Mangrovicoccus algicola]MBE3637732.1 LuxR family transcriptional regulator [Mangrovicoccus algicola]